MDRAIVIAIETRVRDIFTQVDSLIEMCKLLTVEEREEVGRRLAPEIERIDEKVQREFPETF